jgi:hypothetical protein
LRSFCRVRLLALALAACGVGNLPGQLQPNSSQNAATIRGTVLNRVTHEPIARALVASSDNRFAVLTDSQGHFEFTIAGKADSSNSLNPPGGRTLADDSDNDQVRIQITLNARKPGFLSDEQYQTGNVSAAGTKEVTLTLVPEAMIVGKVTLPSSEPPDTITLQAYRFQVQNGRGRWVLQGTAQSRSDGEFRFSELAAGTYKLFTTELSDRDPLTTIPGGPSYGYPPVYFPNTGDFESASNVHLLAGATFQANLSLVKQRYYNVRVPVLNAPADGNLQVSVMAQGKPGPGFSLGYVNEDSAIEGMLPNGNYTLEGTNFGQHSANGSVNISIHDAGVNGPPMVLAASRPIVIHVREEFTGPDNSGSSTYSVNGHNFTLQGPRKYLNLSLESADGFSMSGSGSLRPPSSSGSDPLVLDNVRPGRYWVAFFPSRGYVASATSGELDLLRQPLVVGAGGVAEAIEITMRDDFAHLEVKLDAKKGLIYCIPLADSPGQSVEGTIFSSNGTIMQALAPGDYLVLAFKEPQPELEYRNPDAMKAYEPRG